MLTDEIWGITTYFNPARYHSKKENYIKFRTHSKRQGLKLLCVELAFYNESFELDEKDADILIKVNSKDIMWQKERLLNIGFSHLPKECTKIIWIDCDIIFYNDNWVYETKELLDEYCIVQPFKDSYKLKKDEVPPVDLLHISIGGNNGEQLPSFASVINEDGFSPSVYCGHKGFCWAGRRSIFDEIGFYDAAILGEGDSIMSHAFLGVDVPGYTENLPAKFRKHQFQWMEKAYQLVQGSLFFTNGTIYHLYHGEMKDRIYRQKCVQYNIADFDPDEDIKINQETKTWEWNSNKTDFHKFLEEYFYIRKEDGNES